jgi:proteasome accessory factor C
MSQKSKGNRFERLLALIPFLQKFDGIELANAASLFDISEEQLVADLNLIWVCGLPGYSHLELIDVSYDSGFVSIDNAQTLARPLKLTFEEGSALLLAAETLLAIAPAADNQSLIAIRQKLARLIDLPIDCANSSDQERTKPSERRSDVTPESGILPFLLSQLSEPELFVSLDYYSATLDTVISHRVQLVRLEQRSSRAYLLAYSLNEQAHFNFRVDRIRAISKISPTPEEVAPLSAPGKSEEHRNGRTAPSMVTVAIDRSAYWFIQKWQLSGVSYVPERERFEGVIPVYNSTWLERAALSSAGALTLPEPGSLREQIRAAALRTLENYQPSGNLLGSRSLGQTQ